MSVANTIIRDIDGNFIMAIDTHANTIAELEEQVRLRVPQAASVVVQDEYAIHLGIEVPVSYSARSANIIKLSNLS